MSNIGANCTSRRSKTMIALISYIITFTMMTTTKTALFSTAELTSTTCGCILNISSSSVNKRIQGSTTMRASFRWYFQTPFSNFTESKRGNITHPEKEGNLEIPPAKLDPKPMADDIMTSKIHAVISEVAEAETSYSLVKVFEGLGVYEVSKAIQTRIPEFVVFPADIEYPRKLVYPKRFCVSKNVPFIFVQSKTALGNSTGTPKPVMACVVTKVAEPPAEHIEALKQEIIKLCKKYAAEQEKKKKRRDKARQKRTNSTEPEWTTLEPWHNLTLPDLEA